MTVRQLLKKGASVMETGGVENSDSEALWLLEVVLGCRHEDILLGGSEAVSPDKEREFLAKADERAGGRPLQYIIGISEEMNSSSARECLSRGRRRSCSSISPNPA